MNHSLPRSRSSHNITDQPMKMTDYLTHIVSWHEESQRKNHLAAADAIRMAFRLADRLFEQQRSSQQSKDPDEKQDVILHYITPITTQDKYTTRQLDAVTMFLRILADIRDAFQTDEANKQVETSIINAKLTTLNALATPSTSDAVEALFIYQAQAYFNFFHQLFKSLSDDIASKCITTKHLLFCDKHQQYTQTAYPIVLTQLTGSIKKHIQALQNPAPHYSELSAPLIMPLNRPSTPSTQLFNQLIKGFACLATHKKLLIMTIFAVQLIAAAALLCTLPQSTIIMLGATVTANQIVGLSTGISLLLTLAGSSIYCQKQYTLNSIT